MLEELKKALRSYTFLRPRDILKLIPICSLKYLHKGEYLVRDGEYNYHVALVLKGLLKVYVINDDGHERTMLFISENKNAGAYQTMMRDLPSNQNIIALEDTVLAMADFRRFEKLAQANPAIMRYQVMVMKEVLAHTVDQVWFHLVLSPEQRYLRFRREFPKLEQRVTQRDLASYIGITTSSLSRIRARLARA